MNEMWIFKVLKTSVPKIDPSFSWIKVVLYRHKSIGVGCRIIRSQLLRCKVTACSSTPTPDLPNFHVLLKAVALALSLPVFQQSKLLLFSLKEVLKIKIKIPTVSTSTPSLGILWMFNLLQEEDWSRKNSDLFWIV